MQRRNYSSATAKITLDKLLANIANIKKTLSSHTAFMAVIKANGYGHGAVRLAQAMEESEAVDYFGVIHLQEALELREASIKTPILILGALRISEIDLAIQNKITMTVFSKDIAETILERSKILNQKAHVHLKIDTGMARLGVSTFEEAYKLYQILDNSLVNIEGIFTHFVDAENPGPDSFSHQQFVLFQQIIEQFKKRKVFFDIVHSCNTAGTLNFPQYHQDMVRVGLGLYGYNPITEKSRKNFLTPIQNIDVLVVHVKTIPAETGVGYNHTYHSTKPLRVATIAIGYADGVPKSLSNKASFTYKGIKLPIIGQICMDQIMLDCSNVPDLSVGDSVNYFGDPNEGYSSIVNLAKAINSSEYELLCRIGNRVERVYI